jgi:hypothetical protein
MKLGQVMHTCNPRALEAEAGGSRVPGQPGLHTLKKNKINLLSQENKINLGINLE